MISVFLEPVEDGPVVGLRQGRGATKDPQVVAPGVSNHRVFVVLSEIDNPIVTPNLYL